MTRRVIREGIASFFGAGTWDATGRIWRDGPLAAAGLAGVRPYLGKRVPDSDYTADLTPGRAMGAIMLVHLPQTNERRIALGGATSGEKRVAFNAGLWIYHYAQQPHTETAQADLDDLLEAIVDHIHGDRTLGGAVTEAGESAAGITTRMDPPVRRGERTESLAVVTFDAVTYITA